MRVVAVLVAVLALSVVPVSAADAQGESFHPDQRLSKGWFGVLTYKFVRDEIPGGRDALSRCDQTDRFDDLGGQSPFKRGALNCLAGLGYFDEVPAPRGSPDDGSRFHPGQRLSKGWFGVLTYKFVRDEIPGGRDALGRCGQTDRFDDLGGESPFKRGALNCLAGLGYFDEVPLPDGSRPAWGTAPPGEAGDDARAAARDCVFSSSQATEAVWRVDTADGTGSAFYVGERRWLTAAHVVQNSSEAKLALGDASIDASILGGDLAADMALLQAGGTVPSAIPVMPFGRLSDIEPGDTVYAVGFPLGQGAKASVTRGVVSRIDTDDNLGTLIVTDAAVSPGNSGGPLLDSCGRVVGMVVAKLVHIDVEGISYAIAASTLAERLPRITAGGPPTVSERTWVECFGEEPSTVDEPGWTAGDGRWWHHRHPEGGSAYLWTGQYRVTDHDDALPDGCDFEPYLYLSCSSTDTVTPFWLGVWWGGLPLTGDANGRVEVVYSFDGGPKITRHWWVSRDGSHSVAHDGNARSFTSPLRRADRLVFEGRDDLDRLVIRAEFPLSGVQGSVAHLRQSCGWPTSAPPAAPAPTTTGAWATHRGDNIDGAYVASFVEGRAFGAGDQQDPPLLIVRCGVAGASDNDAAFVTTPFVIFNDFATERSTVKWRIAPTMSTPETESDWWSNENTNSTVWAPQPSSLASMLKATRAGTLYLAIVPTDTAGRTRNMEFDITGAATALANLTCH